MKISVFISTLIFTHCLLAQEVTVINCHDGDTCKVKDSKGKNFSVRFWGIDAPESKQTFGASSARHLNDLIKGKKIVLECEGQSYDRKVCKVIFNKQDLGEQLVRQGYAWDYIHFTKGKYQSAQAEAQKNKRGLWYQEQPINPHCFRSPKAKDCRLKK